MTMRRTLMVAGLAAGLLCAAPLDAQSRADSAAVRAAALDYIEGWYEGNPERMQRALHPELAKRIVETDRATGRSQLASQTAETLVGYTRNGGGRNVPAAEQRKDVRILDMTGASASVRITARDWIDYLHLAKVDGRWVAVNVLWEMTRPGR
jgi:hypothetical protein